MNTWLLCSLYFIYCFIFGEPSWATHYEKEYYAIFFMLCLIGWEVRGLKK